MNELHCVNVVAPRNIQLTPRQSTYQPGDRIRCTSEGNPEPSYQWTDLISGTVIQGDVLVISEDMRDNSHTFQCTARNQYNGKNYTIIDNILIVVQGSEGTSIALTYSSLFHQ